MTEEHQQDKPPFFDRWQHMYLFVLGIHVVVMIAFYFFTRTYHPF